MVDRVKVVVLVSADAEWEAVRHLYPTIEKNASPFGEWFVQDVAGNIIFFQGGWGKISASASTQYVIDQWEPDLLVNLGTCGGFDGQIDRGTIILVESTIVYDILEQMDDDLPFLAYYQTNLDLTWLSEPYPVPVRRTLMMSGDRDLVPHEIPLLIERYGAVAGDWESGAIAWVAARNAMRLLILRGVSDLVGGDGGEAYGDYERFKRAARQIMGQLIDMLPLWLERAGL
jgi:adenosylhomocysteine nucleosidase